MYEVKSITNLLSLSNIFSFLILLVLVFLGVAGRISIDIEISNKTFKQIKFLPRYLIAFVLSYVIELFLAEHETARKYYSEIIILFSIFVNDIVRFIFQNISKIIVYILTGLTKGIFDLKKFFVKDEDKEKLND